MLIAWQGDPNFNNEQGLEPEQYDGYTEIVAALRQEAIDYPGQVVLVHGDSHYFRIDKPLTYDSGRVVANFTRVETFGEDDTQWVSARVDPDDPNLFSFAPEIGPDNVNSRP